MSLESITDTGSHHEDSTSECDDTRLSSFGPQDKGVAVSQAHDNALILDHKGAEQSIIAHRYTPQEWAAFILGVKAGEFDFDIPGIND